MNTQDENISEGIQTRSLPQFEYIFNPSKPKTLGQGALFFSAQRKKQFDENKENQDIKIQTLGHLPIDCLCSICRQFVLVTDEFIRILDCNHIYHRICMIHHVAKVTNKRFFLTKKERHKIVSEEQKRMLDDR